MSVSKSSFIFVSNVEQWQCNWFLQSHQGYDFRVDRGFSSTAGMEVPYENNSSVSTEKNPIYEALQIAKIFSKKLS